MHDEADRQRADVDSPGSRRAEQVDQLDPRDERLARVVPWLVVALGAIVSYRLLGGPLLDAIVRGRIFDDAFLYLLLAESVVERGTLEFYPGMPTNGFQPLWLMLLVAARAITPDAISSELVLRLLSVTVFLLGGVAWLRLLRQHFPPRLVIGFLGFTVVSVSFQMWVVRGLETPLLWALLPLHLGLAHRAFERDDDALTNGLVVGVTGGLVFLTRTDCFVFAAAAALLALHRRRPRLLVGICVGAAALALPYLAFNVIYFDGLVPLSGRAKQLWMDAWYPGIARYLGSYEWWGLADAMRRAPIRTGRVLTATDAIVTMLAATALVTVALTWSRTAPTRRPATSLLLALGLPALLHTLVMLGYHRETRIYTSYYFLPQVLFVLFCGIMLLDVAVRRWSRRHVLVWTLIATSMFAGALGKRIDPKVYWEDRYRIAEFVRTETPPDATLGAHWPGYFAFQVGRPVLPLDGVFASRAYQDEVVFRGRELVDLCTRPDPYLIVRTPVEPAIWLADPDRTVPDLWTFAGLFHLEAFGLERVELVEAFGVWGLLRLDCRGEPKSYGLLPPLGTTR